MAIEIQPKKAVARSGDSSNLGKPVRGPCAQDLLVNGLPCATGTDYLEYRGPGNLPVCGTIGKGAAQTLYRGSPIARRGEPITSSCSPNTFIDGPSQRLDSGAPKKTPFEDWYTEELPKGKNSISLRYESALKEGIGGAKFEVYNGDGETVLASGTLDENGEANNVELPRGEKLVIVRFHQDPHPREYEREPKPHGITIEDNPGAHAESLARLAKLETWVP